jgi:ATPase subunit of ABC transporter with duplicated ATPase domains
MPELTPEQMFAQCDWTNRDNIVQLFPQYVQEQVALQKITKKSNYPKNVDIECFTMKTPYGDAELLKNTPLQVEANKRQCLYGANGVGKTLMFMYMSEGKIKDFPKHLHVHHCKELENHELSESVLDTVMHCYPHRNILIRCEAQIRKVLAEAEAASEPTVPALKENLEWIVQQCNSIRVYDAEDRAKKMLRVLGFDDIGMARLCVALSGGLRMRVALCMAFFIEADLLLLDEPTNHLDFPSVLWLENRLRGYRGSFLLVSHDRILLNNVCTAVMLMEDRQIKYYMCGFSDFEKKKAADDKKKEDEINKFLVKNVNVDPSTMLGRQKAEKKAWSEAYQQKQVALAGKFTFPEAITLENPENLPASDISLINLKDVRFSYKPEDGHFIFNSPVSFNVTASTRTGVLGPNGAGKSTLLKLLTKKLVPTEGSVTHHPNFKLAYFGQHSTAELNLQQTPSEFMGDQFPEEKGGVLRGHLTKTGVLGSNQDTRMEGLSFSQRSCVIFAKLTFYCPHLLILDEPTNFLDLESVDSLIAACNKYKGALLLVSHNRDFLQRCAKQFLSVVPGQFLFFDNLKTAERATYTFIEEMEEGGSISNAANIIKKNPGGGSVHSSQKTDAFSDVKEEKDAITGMKVLTIGGTMPAPAKKAAVTAVAFKENDKVQALWTDGKWYKAVVKKVLPGNKYTVNYTEYGNTANVPSTSVKALAAAPATATKAAPKK